MPFIHADVFRICENGSETVHAKGTPGFCCVPGFVQRVGDLLEVCTVAVHLKSNLHRLGLYRLDFEPLVRSCYISERQMPGRLCFRGRFVHAARNVFAQVRAVPFRHGLDHAGHDDSAASVRDKFFCRNKLDAKIGQVLFINCAFLPVAEKTVEFPHDHHIEATFFTIAHEPLKIRAVVAPAGDAAVNVFAYHFIIVPVGELATLPKLTLYTDFFLILSGGKPCVDYRAEKPTTSIG